MKKPRILTVTATAALLLVLSACSTATQEAPVASPSVSNGVAAQGACEGDEGVTLIVDASALDSADDVSTEWCVFADGTIAAADVLPAAGVAVEGTEEYGDQVVCRVNGVPAEDLALKAEDGSDYFETCAAMPAAFAYWSLWVQPAGGEWAYAEEGISTLQLEPGESVELLFTLNGEPAAPAA